MASADQQVIQRLLSRMRTKLSARGARGIFGIGRAFRIFDDNRNGVLSRQEFTKALGDAGVFVSQSEMHLLFEYYDKNRTGGIDYEEFLQSVRGEMSMRRVRAVEQAFLKLDHNQNGEVTMEEMFETYDPSQHPDVVGGKKTPKEIILEFMETFEGHDKDGIITLNEFKDYYKTVSASIDDDNYFCMMMWQAWNNCNNKNQKCAKQFVTHAAPPLTAEKIHHRATAITIENNRNPITGETRRAPSNSPPPQPHPQEDSRHNQRRPTAGSSPFGTQLPPYGLLHQQGDDRTEESEYQSATHPHQLSSSPPPTAFGSGQNGYSGTRTIHYGDSNRSSPSTSHYAGREVQQRNLHNASRPSPLHSASPSAVTGHSNTSGGANPSHPVHIRTLLRHLKDVFVKRGVRGIFSLGRAFRIFDDDGSRHLSLAEFSKAMHDYRMNINEQECRLLFSYFDTDKSNSIDYNEFLIGIRGDLNDRRRSIIERAFRKFDRDGSGLVNYQDLRKVYNASKHPDVKSGKKNEEEALLEFLDTFDVGLKDGVVSLSEFENYYRNVSASIDDDDYFEVMICNAWRLNEIDIQHVTSASSPPAESVNKMKDELKHKEAEIQKLRGELAAMRVGGGSPQNYNRGRTGHPW